MGIFNLKFLNSGLLMRSEDRPEFPEYRDSQKTQKPQKSLAPRRSGVLSVADAVALVAIAACGSDDGGTASSSGDSSKQLTADTEIFLANQSVEERGSLDEAFKPDSESGELGDALQSWAEFILDDSSIANEKLDGTAGLWICGADEFSTLRAMARSVFPSIPQADAPGDLAGAPLPTSRPAYLAVVGRLPETLDGATREEGSGQEVVYLDDAGDRRFVIEAGDFSDSDYGGEWNASDGLIARLLSPYFVGSEIAVDDDLLWLRFSAPENDSEFARTIHAINWGEAEASIWFQALAFTQDDVYWRRRSQWPRPGARGRCCSDRPPFESLRVKLCKHTRRHAITAFSLKPAQTTRPTHPEALEGRALTQPQPLPPNPPFHEYHAGPSPSHLFAQGPP